MGIGHRGTKYIKTTLERIASGRAAQAAKGSRRRAPRSTVWEKPVTIPGK